MKGFEAIILAGGLGTRIRSLVADRPKVMVDVGGRPFLEMLLERAAHGGVTRAILATGYLHESVATHFGSRWGEIDIVYSIDDKPLGTGGAVWKALQAAARADVFVFNGDTFFDVDLRSFRQFHHSHRNDVTLALKPMRHFDRYGTVTLANGRVTGFHEKRFAEEGLINGGVYLINRRCAGRLMMPKTFSLEADLLEKKVDELKIGGYVSDGYFIDIGMPEDYGRAQRDLTAKRF